MSQTIRFFGLLGKSFFCQKAPPRLPETKMPLAAAEPLQLKPTKIRPVPTRETKTDSIGCGKRPIWVQFCPLSRLRKSRFPAPAETREGEPGTSRSPCELTAPARG